MKAQNITKICFHAAFWPASILIVLSFLLSGIFFNQHINNLYKKEINRHELIYQLVSKAIVGDIIIRNDDAIYVVLKEFKNKYNLENIRLLTNKGHNKPYCMIAFLKNKPIKSLWTLSGISPSQIIEIESKFQFNEIIAPLSLSLAIIMIFIVASIIMYRRIKSQLYLRIVEPLQHTLESNESSQGNHFNHNLAAAEITDLFHKTQSFIKAIHEQRDLIEQNKIEEAKYQVALQVTHDIRSPVLALETISEISDLNSESKFLIKKVMKRIIEIADNMLESHAPLPQSGVNQEDGSLGQCIESLIQEKQVYCHNKSITITAKIDPLCYKITCKIPTSLLSRAISNIINNSIEAIDKENGLIQVTVNADSDYITITISDNGCGIDEKYQARVFDRNFSLNKPEGNGLGLSFAKQLIESFNGRIQLDSKPLHRTVIRCIIQR